MNFLEHEVLGFTDWTAVIVFSAAVTYFVLNSINYLINLNKKK